MSVKYYAKFWKETCEKIHEALGCENRTQVRVEISDSTIFMSMSINRKSEEYHILARHILSLLSFTPATY